MDPPRLFFGALLAPEVLSAVKNMLEISGLASALGGAMFGLTNLHQSFSSRVFLGEPGPTGRLPRDQEKHDQMLRAGSRITAQGFKLLLDQVVGHGGGKTVHWAIRTSREAPPAFKNLLTVVHDCMSFEGLDNDPRHTPHVTISYRARRPLKLHTFPPIVWHIDRVFLLEGGGDPYHYKVIKGWKLLPASDDLKPPQLELGL